MMSDYRRTVCFNEGWLFGAASAGSELPGDTPGRAMTSITMVKPAG